MKSVLLIGLGRFGRHIAEKLNELGHEIMAVDISEERVNSALGFVTNAQIGDSTNKSFLESLGIKSFDACIVTIGDNFQSSLETASLLKELGAKKVIARASRGVQEKFRARYPGQVPFAQRRRRGRLPRKAARRLDRDPLRLRPHIGLHRVRRRLFHLRGRDTRGMV